MNILDLMPIPAAVHLRLGFLTQRRQAAKIIAFSLRLCASALEMSETYFPATLRMRLGFSGVSSVCGSSGAAGSSMTGAGGSGNVMGAGGVATGVEGMAPFNCAK